MNKMRLIIALIFVSFLGLQSQAQKYSSGPQVLSFHSNVDDTDQPYAIYLPENFDENKNYPFVVMLHGAGSNHRLALKRAFGKSNKAGENDVEASSYFPTFRNVEYIVASPLARGTMGYQGVAEKDVWDMIADVKSKFKIDENRTYLTGLSMGGGGTLWIGLSRPDFWAAIAPVCPAAPEGTAEYLPNASNFPSHFFTGEADPVVPLKMVSKWVDDFKTYSDKVEFTTYPNVQHNSWENAYENGQIFDWFNKFVKDPNPKQVKFATASLKHNKAFWVEVLGINQGKTAYVDANFDDNKQLNVTTLNIDAFRILPSEHLKIGGSVLLAVNGPNYIRINNFTGNEIIEVNGGLAKIAGNKPFAKTHQQHGPMTEVAADRHIYVYGTLDKPEKTELEKRRNLAIEAANWSFYRGEFLGRVMVFPRVLADTELKESDIANANLVLFGTTETNAQIAKYKDQLPFEFKGDSTESLTYIFPNEKKTVLINSGFPFWEINDKGDNFLRILRNPSKITMLSGYGDWVYSDKKSGEIIWGYFDNNWKLSDGDETKLGKVGALEVRE